MLFRSVTRWIIFQILELDWKSPGRKSRSKQQKKLEKDLAAQTADESAANLKAEENKYGARLNLFDGISPICCRVTNEIDEFESEDASTTNSISVTSFRSAGEFET